MMNIEVRRLSTRKFDEAVQLWNEGFQGYLVDMTLSLDRFLARLIMEDLSLSRSLVALCDGQPAGFLLNGIRNNGVHKVAWNGGTGVRPEFRGRHVGRALVEAAIEVYKEEEVHHATLEALAGNDAAIALYQKCGYEIIERLVILHCETSLASQLCDSDRSYSVRTVQPHEVARLDFYRSDLPWQVQWQSVAAKKGSALIVTDTSGVVVGYALYRCTFTEAGTLAVITLFQCEARTDQPDPDVIIASALERVYSPLDVQCRRNTSNLSESNELVRSCLEKAGFSTFVEQVHMIKVIN
jgi:ribosomal protein S18 acetylase RimI-like enzyme